MKHIVRKSTAVFVLLLCTGCQSAAGTSGSASQAASSVQTETSAEEENVNYYNNVDEYSVYWEQDYGHSTSDELILGTGETATIEITAKPCGLTADDMVIIADEAPIDRTEAEISYDEAKDETVYSFDIRGNTAGSGNLYIFPLSDYFKYGNDLEGIALTIHQLDEEEGRIVWCSDSDQLYHYDEECSGYGMATTIWDAEQKEYQPCSECVKE